MARDPRATIMAVDPKKIPIAYLEVRGVWSMRSPPTAQPSTSIASAPPTSTGPIITLGTRRNARPRHGRSSRSEPVHSERLWLTGMTRAALTDECSTTRESAASRLINASPVYYGWVIVVAGAIGMVLTSPGQTYAVSVFIDHFINDLGLSRSVVSTLYTVRHAHRQLCPAVCSGGRSTGVATALR